MPSWQTWGIQSGTNSADHLTFHLLSKHIFILALKNKMAGVITRAKIELIS